MLDHYAGLCSAPSRSDKYNLTTITSKCVALCYSLFVSDAALNRGGVIGAIKGLIFCCCLGGVIVFVYGA